MPDLKTQPWLAHTPQAAGRPSMQIPFQPQIDPAALSAAIAQVEQIPRVEQQQRQLANLSRLAAASVPSPQVDLSALGAYVETITGRNPLRGYRPPPTPEEIAARGLQAAVTVQDQSAKLLDQVSGLARLTSTSKSGDVRQRLADERALFNLSNKLTPFAGLIQNFKDLDETIGGFENWTQEDIPGVGLTGKFPLFALSDKGSEISELVTGLRNQLLYLRSGAQINEQEFQRLSRSLGAVTFASDRDLIQGLKNFKSEMKGVFLARSAGFKPEIVDLYRSQGGPSVDLIDTIGKSPPTETSVIKPSAAGAAQVGQVKIPSEAELRGMSTEELKAFMNGGP
jgi:hypothetical protein